MLKEKTKLIKSQERVGMSIYRYPVRHHYTWWDMSLAESLATIETLSIKAVGFRDGQELWLLSDNTVVDVVTSALRQARVHVSKQRVERIVTDYWIDGQNYNKRKAKKEQMRKDNESLLEHLKRIYVGMPVKIKVLNSDGGHYIADTTITKLEVHGDFFGAIRLVTKDHSGIIYMINKQGKTWMPSEGFDHLVRCIAAKQGDGANISAIDLVSSGLLGSRRK